MDPQVFVSAFVTDIGLIGGLLLLGAVLRAKVPVFRWLMLPAPVIAGILGFLLGPHVFGALAESQGWRIGGWQVTGLPFSPLISSYTTLLIAVVFSCMALTQEFQFSNLTGRVRGLTGYGIVMSAGQVAVGMLLAIVLLRPVFDAPMSMGLILFASWSGGFGTSAAIGDVFAANGHEEVSSIAFTSATVGMLTGIIGGVIIARIGTSRGYAKALGKWSDQPQSLRTGILSDSERSALGQSTMSGSSIESLGLHVALVGMVLALGYTLQGLTAQWLNAFALPVFATAFLVGMLVRWIMARVGALRVVDPGTTKSISGTASDVLIVCGMVSITPSFVADHLGALLVIFAVGLAFCLFLGLVVAPRVLGKHWFEKQIFTWGWATGSVATGIALLRIVDPESESNTVEDFGYAYLPLIPIEGAAVAVAPILVIAGFSWSVALIWAAIALIGAWMLRGTKVPQDEPIPA